MSRVTLNLHPGRVPAIAPREPVEAWEVLGRAIADYFEGRREHTVWLIQEDGECWPLTLDDFFRGEDELPAAEAAALEICSGRVLDVGAGAGCHALILQARGFEVLALDVCPQAVEVMRRRGVAHAIEGDIFDPAVTGVYDTLLLLMNGIGLVGDLDGLERFLDRAQTLAGDGGQILLDSCDLRQIGSERELQRIATRIGQGRYRGETCQQLLYRGLRGSRLAWLYLDADTLAERARRRGWRSQVVFEDEEGAYLARLVRA